MQNLNISTLLKKSHRPKLVLMEFFLVVIRYKYSYSYEPAVFSKSKTYPNSVVRFPNKLLLFTDSIWLVKNILDN